MDLTGKTAIVTGGARGIGAATALALAKAGANVVMTDVLDNPGEAMAEQLRAAGLLARYAHLDVTDFEAWKQLLSATFDIEGRIDILVNNAGIHLRKNIDDIKIDEWSRVLAVNLNGVLFGIKAVVPFMRAGRAGSIVNIASISALGASPNVAYGTSKWGVRGLTKSAAFEYGKWKIRVNAVLPGVILTDLTRGSDALEIFRNGTPLGALATPDDVAAMVVFLASDNAAAITGQDYIVDGGFTAGQHPAVVFKSD